MPINPGDFEVSIAGRNPRVIAPTTAAAYTGLWESGVAGSVFRIIVPQDADLSKIYYVGKGGNDGNSGLTWALRKLTLNGAEDVPVVANDTVIVGPGTYREQLTCDVSGTHGSPITYIGDVSGRQTDLIGGVVRVTGSDDDLVATRGYCFFTATAGHNYRTYRGFLMDTTTSHLMNHSNSTNIIIEDCAFGNQAEAKEAIQFSNVSTDAIIRRCVFIGGGNSIVFNDATVVDNSNHLIENCLFIGSHSENQQAVNVNRHGNIVIKNCTFFGGRGYKIVATNLTGGQTVTVNNCLFRNSRRCLSAGVLGEIVENYNMFFGAGTIVNVTAGVNSIFTEAILFETPNLLDGFVLSNNWILGVLAQTSTAIQQTGTGESTDDLFGITRPVTSAKKSWGAIQAPKNLFNETTIVDGGTYSRELQDAGRLQFAVPVENSSTVFRVSVYREASYAGTNPQMIIKQDGQANVVVLDAGASGQWNELETTITPDSTTTFVIVELVSNNTAVAGSYSTFFDNLVLDPPAVVV